MSIQQAYSYPLTALGQSWTRPSDRTTARLDTLSHGTVSTYALGGPGTAWDGLGRPGPCVTCFGTSPCQPPGIKLCWNHSVT